MNAPITHVTVLEDRAAITRRGRFAIIAGQHRFVIEGVSPVLVDKTLTATASGARVLDVRCERYLAPWRDPDGGAADGPVALRVERVTLESSRDAALARVHAAQAEIAALREVLEAAHHELAIHATRGTVTPGATAQLAELDAADRSARSRQIDAELSAEAAARALARLEERIARAEAEAGDVAARLVIDLLAESATDVALTIGYVVPGAAWRPYHRAVLARAAGRVDWTTTACVWQATGEDWVDAELTFSLERPSLGVEPPALADDEIRARKRPDTVTVEAREQEQQTTGLGGGAFEVPGIDDGGLGLKLTAARTTVRQDGMPHRVPVGGFTAPTQLSLSAIPLRSPWVHIRSRITNASTQPLLAGPVDLIMASGYVGRAEIGFVAAGEKFHIGFGPEADVRAHRTETRERDDAGLLGGWNVQTVKVAIRLSNLGTERREIVVTDRVPVSEVEQVEIQVSPPDAVKIEDQVTARAIDERGIVTWAIDLPPLGRRAVTLEYKIKSQRGVAGV